MAFEYCVFSRRASTGRTESPPSLTFSDLSSVGFEDFPYVSMDKDDATVVLQKTMTDLNRVAEHLREQGCNESANEIAKSSIQIITTFNDATATWDIERCLMNQLPPTCTKNTSPSVPSSIMQLKNLNGGSWAAVAATATDEGNRLVKFRPSDSLKKTVQEEEPKVNPENLRVVWIMPWDERAPLSSVSERITSGPLLSMCYSPVDNAMCIIFQNACSATELISKDTELIRATGTGVYGPNYQLVQGGPYEKDDDLQLMENPVNERRRLTFARQQLFANGMTEELFKQEIYTIVGKHNVELVWLFNTGNATVVFSATLVARKVREEFRLKSRQPGPFKDVQVSFSHDPCERPIHLITQLPFAGAGQIAPPRGSKSVSSVVGSGSSGRRPSNAPARSEDDGWTTVMKKR